MSPHPWVGSFWAHWATYVPSYIHVPQRPPMHETDSHSNGPPWYLSLSRFLTWLHLPFLPSLSPRRSLLRPLFYITERVRLSVLHVLRGMERPRANYSQGSCGSRNGFGWSMNRGGEGGRYSIKGMGLGRETWFILAIGCCRCSSDAYLVASYYHRTDKSCLIFSGRKRFLF